MKNIVFNIIIAIALFSSSFAQKTNLTDTLTINANSDGINLQIEFVKGKYHKYPLMAFWIEDLNENYIQELYVAKSVAKGIFKYGDTINGKWSEGERLHLSTLPYWSHKRNIKKNNYYVPQKGSEVIDAHTGATPKSNFILNVKTDKKQDGKIRLLMEINQFYDYNFHYTNNLMPENLEYKKSAQPSVIYAVTIDLNNKNKIWHMNAIGHGSLAGENGDLNTDLSKLSSALEIVKSIIVKVK